MFLLQNNILCMCKHCCDVNMYVSVCANRSKQSSKFRGLNTHTYIYINVYVCMYVCTHSRIVYGQREGNRPMFSPSCYHSYVKYKHTYEPL